MYDQICGGWVGGGVGVLRFRTRKPFLGKSMPILLQMVSPINVSIASKSSSHHAPPPDCSPIPYKVLNPFSLRQSMSVSDVVHAESQIYMYFRVLSCRALSWDWLFLKKQLLFYELLLIGMGRGGLWSNPTRRRKKEVAIELVLPLAHMNSLSQFHLLPHSSTLFLVSAATNPSKGPFHSSPLPYCNELNYSILATKSTPTFCPPAPPVFPNVLICTDRNWLVSSLYWSVLKIVFSPYSFLKHYPHWRHLSHLFTCSYWYLSWLLF